MIDEIQLFDLQVMTLTVFCLMVFAMFALQVWRTHIMIMMIFIQTTIYLYSFILNDLI